MESSAPSNCEVQAVIKFLNVEGVTRLQIHLILTNDMVHLIPSLKRDIGGRHFATEEDLLNEVAEFFAKQDAKWYSTGIHKLILCYNNCLHEQGDYVEKKEILRGIQ